MRKRLGVFSGEVKALKIEVPQIPQEISAYVGDERCSLATMALRELKEAVDALPNAARTCIPGFIKFETTDSMVAQDQLAQMGISQDNGWIGFMAENRDGGYTARAYHLLDPVKLGSSDVSFALLSAVIHHQIFDWFLPHAWRSVDLGLASLGSLRSWEILPSACCARALLEGAVALKDETTEMVSSWRAFKHKGLPGSAELREFYGKDFGPIIISSSLGTRIPSMLENSPDLQKKNILTSLRKTAKKLDGVDLMEVYHWLCDAVHPSFGSSTVYSLSRGSDHEGLLIFNTMARRVPDLEVEIPPTEPTVAIAVVDALYWGAKIASEALVKASLLYSDFALTTEIAFRYIDGYYFGIPRPSRNALCPCNSGKKWKKCMHSWGDAGEAWDSLD